MGKLVWTGPRESDIAYTGDFFDGSVTLYGNGKRGSSFCSLKDYRINHNHITKEQTDYMMDEESKIIRQNPDVEFLSYNPNLIFGCLDDVVKRTTCMNEEELMHFLDSKKSFRDFAEPFVPTLHSIKIMGSECTVQRLRDLYPDTDAWIVQGDIASGGYQTYLMREENADVLIRKLDMHQIYLVSKYYERNIPVNIHAIIYEHQILLTPASIQVIGEDRNRLLYRGADYIECQKIDKKVMARFQENARIFCEAIQKKGYRGILGIDAIIIDGEALLLEVNNRFQASTILINKALQDAGMPSLHELHYEAFKRPMTEIIDQKKLSDLTVPYSIYTFLEEECGQHAKHIYYAQDKEKSVIDFVCDGYDPRQDTEQEAYLYRLIFNVNIVSLTDNAYVYTHPNLLAPGKEWYDGIVNSHDIKKIKISLLNQGVTLDEEVKQYLENNGGMRPGVYFAVDLTLEGRYIVNSPLYVKFAALSPYSVRIRSGRLFLYYYDNEICEATIEFADKLAKQSIKIKHRVKLDGTDGDNPEKKDDDIIPIEKICLLATDRLRIQNTDCCTFKERHIPCRFCEVQYKKKSFGIDEILDATSYYFKEDAPQFRHVLLGGLSNRMGEEKHNICEIIKYIRKHSDMPIYMMCLPCTNTEDIEEYVKLGVTEIGFNIEIFDRDRAAHYMPGKGKISLETYRRALEKAVSLLGRDGAVRTAFVVGLEDMESLLAGVEYVCQIGVAPIFSVFRPIPGTEMGFVNPPTNEWLLEAYERAEKICRKYGLHMGPSCPACQNNTLAFDELK